MRPDFDKNGLVPAIVRSEIDGEVLMLAYMNGEAYDLTLSTGKTWFFSRSRGRLWNKGETSGNYQEVAAISLDCDADTILVTVREKGPACHTGSRSCFFNKVI